MTTGTLDRRTLLILAAGVALDPGAALRGAWRISGPRWWPRSIRSRWPRNVWRSCARRWPPCRQRKDRQAGGRRIWPRGRKA